MGSHNMSSFVSGFFQSAEYCRGSSVYERVVLSFLSLQCSFVWLSHLLFLYSLSSRTNMWIACSLGLLYIILLYHLHLSFYMNIRFHFSWVDSYLSKTAGSHGRNMSNFLRNFFKVAGPFYIPISNV